jgi:WD40 repeat protein
MGGVKVFDPNRDPRGRGLFSWLDQVGAMAFDTYGLRILGIACDFGMLASASPLDGAIHVEHVLPVTDAPVRPRADFALSPDGRRLAAPLREDRTVVGVWDVALGRPVAILRASGGLVTAVAFRQDGQSLATAAVGGPKGCKNLTVWHLASDRAIRTFESEGPHPVEALAFSSDGRQLAAGGGQQGGPGWVSVWDLETHAVVGTLDGVGVVKFLAFHPDGTRLAVADFGAANVHLWDPAAGTLITNPAPRAVSYVGFTPDGTRLTAMGYDGNAHLCDARTGEEVLVLRSFGHPPGSEDFTPRIAFSPDGSVLAGHYGLGRVLNVWDLGPRSGLAAEPEASDLAGWLRRSRALAEEGDSSAAEAAYARAQKLNGSDPSRWIEHAVSLWCRSDSPQARDALARAMGSLPDDTGRWIDLGRLLARFGWTTGSATALAKARSLLESRLSGAPEDEAAAGALAELFPDADPSPGWNILQPTVMTSAAGATLTRLPDGSVLPGGLNAVGDTYTVEAMTGLSGITGLRLEVIPDPSLPFQGPGRYGTSGNFHLDGIRVSALRESEGSVPVRLSRACADYSDRRFGLQGVRGTLDLDPNTAWSIWPQVSRPHWAVFQIARPIGTGAGTRLRVELTSQAKFAHNTLGRFRLSVMNRSVPLLEAGLASFKGDRERNGLTRLGAAYYIVRDWARAAAVLERVAARPGTSALERFLLALAHHHLGRTEEARTDCDRALERLRTDPAEDETRDVAVATLMLIRGLGIEEAESLLLDSAFPADPFAH